MTAPSEDIVDQIRRRPGMFVGDTHDGSGLLHLLWEIVGNAIDEHLAGFCRRIEITLHEGGGAAVEDDGRGIPVEPLPDGTPWLVAVLTRMHDRATFDGHTGHVHLDGGGLGLVVVNATSQRMIVETTRAGRRYRHESERGVPLGPIVDLGPTAKVGTRILFTPDPRIFTHLDLDATQIRERLHQIACFRPGLALQLADERRTVFSCPNGLLDLLARELRGPTRTPIAPLHAAGERDGVRVEVALTWASHAHDGRIRSFVNMYETREGGSHVTGLQRALHELVEHRPRADRARLADALRARAVGVISVFHHDPTFEGPTRSKLASPEVRPVVEDVMRRCLRDFEEQRPDDARRLIASAMPPR